jgi:hypothetical protein
VRKLLYLPIVIVVAALLFFATSGSFLVVDRPDHSDAIVVLAGETDRRPARALELLSQGYALRVLIDIPASDRIFGHNLLQLAQEYVNSLAQAKSVDLCSIVGLSTKAETQDVAQCLETIHAHKVLLVTSDYHTRRALSIFSRELPQYQFSVAAAIDPQQFGASWWKRRQWAKMNFDEWTRLVWWEAVDRWR